MIKLISNYSKRLGLPGFSSHQFSVSIETELVTTDDIPGETARIYQLLQSNVDQQILSTGFVPPKDYGFEPSDSNSPANPPQADVQREPAWRCTQKQRDLILKIVEEHQLDKDKIEALAIERFGKGVRHLNKVEASGLIDELLDTHGGENRHAGGNHRSGSAYGRDDGRRAA
ncbi:MAG: hypothetical protein ABIS50_16315 [Luteolibacter sp.]|uniref:hypothetical protein n=1 Tax=Luteolibacter sp. TaxID=1962973 RepID=UPI0032642A82